VLCVLGRPVALGTGSWGSRKDHSSSERSLWYAFLKLGILPSECLSTPFQTVSGRSSQDSPSMHSGEYQALGVEESKLNSMPVLGVPARDMEG
jgi:hypothetical protein